jgi:hypothetical protein
MISRTRELGKSIPYGIWDTSRNEGWVSVGVDHDTAAFAVASIQNWWTRMGQQVYPEARELLITADSGGSNGYRTRLWKRELQPFADETGLTLTVCHFPPGTSKWNKIEHRMFCHITANWRGRPLSSLEVIVNLIGSTTTKKGLKIQADLDLGTYPKGIEVSDDEMAQVCLRPADFHGEWNSLTLKSRRLLGLAPGVEILQPLLRLLPHDLVHQDSRSIESLLYFASDLGLRFLDFAALQTPSLFPNSLSDLGG